jgi:hypothetical protein
LLANDLYNSHITLKKTLKHTHSIGKSIEGTVISGDINVMTPAYFKKATENVLNIFDDFQFLTCYNLSALTDLEAWSNLVLMSATPHVAILGCVREAGFEIKEITADLPRKNKRFRMWKPKLGELQIDRVPNGGIIFSPQIPSLVKIV